MRMEYFVSGVAAGFAEEFVIKLLNRKVFVRFTEFHLLVGIIKDGGTSCLEVDRCLGSRALNGLTAAVDTTAGTSHDFDEIDLEFAGFHLVQKFLRVLCAGSNSNTYFDVAELVGSCLDGSCTANFFKIELFELGVEDNFCRCAESRFHNAARCAEDRTRTGTDVERLIEGFVVESLIVDTCFFDHSCKFACGDRVVYVVDAGTDCALTGTANFKLLRCAGDCGNEDDVCRVKTALACVVGLVHRAEHLLRRFAGGEVFSEFREIVFAVLDPTGRAGCDEREVLAFLHSAEEFGCFFHDGKVCGEVHVVNAVKANAFESGNHLTFGIHAGLDAEAFADGGTDGRRGADRNVFGGIVDGIPNFFGVILFVERAYRASNDTLTAGYARGSCERLIECGADLCIEAAVERFDDADALHILTSGNATAAKDTFVVVTNEESGAFVLETFHVSACETVLVGHAEIAAELLQFTAAAADAGETFFLVCGKDEFKVGLSGGLNLGGVCIDFHAVCDFGYASSHKTSCALDFNKAEAASADLIDVLEVAECGNIDFRNSGSVDDLTACGDFIFASVDFYSNHIHV